MLIEQRLSQRAKNLAPSPIRELMKFMSIEGMISLGGGYPNPETFVFKRVDIEFKSGQNIRIEGKEINIASQYGPSDAHARLKKGNRQLAQKKGRSYSG
jgi:kynurenine/2-aminoadipate aminotransferase